MMNRTQKIQASIIWLIVSLFVVYSFCLTTAAAVFTDAIKTSLNVSIFELSIATGAFIFGFACMQIPIGYSLDRFNAKYIVSGGILLLSLGNLALSFANNIIWLAFSNFLQGLGASGAFVASAVLISQWFPKKLFPILIGLTQSAACIASGGLHYIFASMLENHSWNEIYQFLSAFGALLLLASLIFVRSPESGRVDAISLKQALVKTFKNNQILLCSIAAATSFGVLLSFASFWYLDVHKFYLIEKLDSVIISSAIFLGIGIGTPILAWISNILHSRTAVLHFSLVLGTMFLLLGVYLPHFSINTLIIIKVVSFFIGFFLSGSMLFYTMVSELSSSAYRGVALSVLNTFVFIFNTLMLFIPQLFVTNYSKEFFTYLWTLPFFILISVLLLYFIKDTLRTESHRNY